MLIGLYKHLRISTTTINCAFVISLCFRWVQDWGSLLRSRHIFGPWSGKVFLPFVKTVEQVLAFHILFSSKECLLCRLHLSQMFFSCYDLLPLPPIYLFLENNLSDFRSIWKNYTRYWEAVRRKCEESYVLCSVADLWTIFGLAKPYSRQCWHLLLPITTTKWTYRWTNHTVLQKTTGVLWKKHTSAIYLKCFLI